MSRKYAGFSAEQRHELWQRWKDGETTSEIARALTKPPGSIHTVLAANGGIVPAERKRRADALTLEEREEISRGLAAGDSYRGIARRIGREPSTVSREVKRCGGRRKYRAAGADRLAWKRAERPKPCILATNTRLRDLVAAKLAEQWSPEQISGWLVIEFPDDDTMRVSHETIYRTLFIQARGALKKELVAHLRRVRSMRRSANRVRGSERGGAIQDAISISERPPQVEDRAVPGHWEGDLIAGSRNTHVATLVERQTRFLMLVKVDGKDAESVTSALIKHVGSLPDQLRQSLTWDRGAEMASHTRLSLATDMDVYFCDPKSPWQRGTNENTNGLIRQYLPKKTDLARHTQSDLDAIANRLNSRPRKTLGFHTPAQELERVLQ